MKDLDKHLLPEPESLKPKNELTIRSVLVGCLLGGIVTGMNIHFGLQIGWSFGASIMSAIVGYAIFNAIKPSNPYSKLENNITQTAGSAAGSMASAAGLLAPIPALKMAGVDIDPVGMMIWAVSVAFLGVMFAVPLRRQYIIIEKLKFPAGLATAKTIDSLYSGKEGLKQARYLFYFALFAFVWSLTENLASKLEWKFFQTHLTMHDKELFQTTIFATLSTWGFYLYLSPVFIGAGMMIGPKAGISLLIGAVAGWWILGQYAQEMGWAPEGPMVIHNKETDQWGPRGWILWPGVAIMVGDAITSLVLSGKTIINSVKGTKSALSNISQSDSNEDIPNKWWVIGLIIASILTVVLTYIYFSIPPLLTICSLLLSFVLANVAVRSVGEVDINPIGGMGKVTQIVFGGISKGLGVSPENLVPTNLMGAAITGAGASQAGDMMTDFKTGHELGASPKKQFIAQLWGILAGIFFAVPIYLLFDHLYDIGAPESKYGAPAAKAWFAVAKVVSEGFDKLPVGAASAMLIAFIFGSLLPILSKFIPKLRPYIPSGIAIGIAFIIPGFYSIIFFIGAIVYVIWNKANKSQCQELMFPVACGLLAGEGLGSIVFGIGDLISQYL